MTADFSLSPIILSLNSWPYFAVFCQIRNCRIRLKIFAGFYLLGVLRTSLFDPCSSILLILIKLYLLGHYILNDRDKCQSLFYAGYSFFFSFSTFNLLLLLYQNLLSDSLPEISSAFLITAIWTTIPCFHRWLLQQVNLDTSFLRGCEAILMKSVSCWVYLLTALLLVCHKLEIGLYQLEILSVRSKHLILVYALAISGVLICLNNKINNQKQELFYRCQTAYLQDYLKQIEQNYLTLRGFRHDYRNIISSLDLTIRQGNLRQIKSLYQTILLSADCQLTTSCQLDGLVNLKHLALKGLLCQKIKRARELGIALELEIEESIETLNMSELDLIRLTAILMDNAIEAAKESPQPRISLALFRDDGGHLFHIKNSRKKGSLVIDELFQPGVSTKGADRGLGLSILRQIISSYQETFLETSCGEDCFSQVLYIGDSHQ